MENSMGETHITQEDNEILVQNLSRKPWRKEITRDNQQKNGRNILKMIFKKSV
jgi:hypothetical protein